MFRRFLSETASSLQSFRWTNPQFDRAIDATATSEAQGARCPFGQTANWTQIIWRANTYLGVRPCTFLGAICYKFCLAFSGKAEPCKRRAAFCYLRPRMGATGSSLPSMIITGLKSQWSGRRIGNRSIAPEHPARMKGAASSSPHGVLPNSRPAKAMSSHLMRGCFSPSEGVSKSRISVTFPTISRFPVTEVYHQAVPTQLAFVWSSELNG
jgi:hypothetical protein